MFHPWLVRKTSLFPASYGLVLAPSCTNHSNVCCNNAKLKHIVLLSYLTINTEIKHVAMWIIIRSFIQTLTLPVNSVKFYGPKWLVQVSHI